MSRFRPTPSPTISHPFVWRPGLGPDAECVQRMGQYLPRPAEPMGEAWFMGDERRMFVDLLGNPDALSLETVRVPLEEIASGTSSFGPLREWTDWYHYLLVHLVRRHAEQSFDSVYQLLVTAFLALHPRGIDEPYPGFADDARQTLGRCLMDPSRWEGQHLALPAPEDPSTGNRNAAFAWHVACGDFSAGMFFCAKYVLVEELDDWLDSVFQIRCPFWTTQLYSWLAEAHPLLTGSVQQLADLKFDPATNVAWLGTHVLNGDYSGSHEPKVLPPFLSAQRCGKVLAAANKRLSIEDLTAWLDAIKPYPYLVTLLGQTPNRIAEAFKLA